MGRQFHFFMGEKEEEELKRYLLDSNVKILFEGKNPREAVRDLMSREKKEETAYLNG